jgi:hypothetical protein
VSNVRQRAAHAGGRFPGGRCRGLDSRLNEKLCRAFFYQIVEHFKIGLSSILKSVCRTF